jgi:hypothetical protein
VGHNAAQTAADPYGTFIVRLRDDLLNPIGGVTVIVDFSACCPGMRLSNTQLGAGVTHDLNSAKVSAITDATGTATFIVEGAANQGTGPSTGATGSQGCATISVSSLYPWYSLLLTNGIDFPLVCVSAPDENGAAGQPGVEATDLSVYIADKNAYYTSNANYRQRSDFDFHLPAFACSAIFNPTVGFGVNLGDLTQWVKIKNGAGSYGNGPFPPACP